MTMCLLCSRSGGIAGSADGDLNKQSEELEEQEHDAMFIETRLKLHAAVLRRDFCEQRMKKYGNGFS